MNKRNSNIFTSLFVNDIATMHAKYDINEAIDKLDKNMLGELLKLRLVQIKEEVGELEDAIEDKDAEETVDALIDILVFTIGTLDVFDIDTDKAWNAVLEPNMNKEPGIKEGRPNPYGLPDLIKPKGWTGPDHSGNHGKFTSLYEI